MARHRHGAHYSKVREDHNGGPGSWASPRMPARPGLPSPVVPYIDAGGRAIAGAALLIIPEGVISKAGDYTDEPTALISFRR